MATIFGPIQALVDLISENQKENIQVAEIGCFDGSTTVAYLPIIKSNNGHLYVVDWFKGEQDCIPRTQNFPHGYSDDDQTVYNTFQENIKEYSDIVTILRGRSEDMIKEIPDKSLDICFIDGDHRYLPVKKDIELLLPKMKDDGIICGHDVEGWSLVNTFTPEELTQHYISRGSCHPGVAQAVYDHFGSTIDIRQDTGCHKIPIWIKRL